MKSNNLFLVLIITIPFFQSYTQNLNDLPPKVKEYVLVLQSYGKNVAVTKEEFIGEIDPDGLQQIDMLQLALYKTRKVIEKLTGEEFKQLVKFRNEALEEDPYELHIFFINDSRENSKNLNINSNSITIKTAGIDGMILNRISKMYGKAAAGLHRMPFLAKVKIIGSSDEIYGAEPIAHLINYDAIVEDICRGYSAITLGKQITFHIVRESKRIKENFKVGQSYFIGCEFIIDKDGKKRLAVWNDGIYPVVDNKIIDLTNPFDTGKEITWNNFKIKILDVINLNYWYKESKKWK